MKPAPPLARPFAIGPLTWFAALSGPVAFGITQVVAPAWVEAHYTLGIGQPVASALGALNGVVGFSVAEAVVLLGVGVGGLRLVQAWPAFRMAPVAWLKWHVPRALVAGSVAYAVFVLAWGLNYRREPIIGRFGFAAGNPSAAEVRSLAIAQVQAANAAREHVAEDSFGVASLFGYDPFEQVAAAFGKASARWAFLGGTYSHAKPVAASLILSYAGLGGVYCPFTGEPNVNADLLEFDLPFSIAHETAHQRGVAREDEANFVGWIVLRDFGNPAGRYGAALQGAYYAVAAFGRADPEAAAALWKTASPGVKRDIDAERKWQARYESPFAGLFEGVNSAYLKSNGVKDGVESYGRMVDLMVAEAR